MLQPTRVISDVRRQQNMPLHDRIIPYLETAGLYHLARLNSQWFWVDEPLISTFIERWHLETHTFHMPFWESTITLQDVAYQLGLPINGEANKVKQMRVCCTWFHERFWVLLADLFADKNANRVHLRWLPYLASMDDLGRYSWGSEALAWLYRCLCRGTNRNVVSLAGTLQLLQSWIFLRFSSLRPSGFDVFGFSLASRWATYLLRNDAGGSKSGGLHAFFWIDCVFAILCGSLILLPMLLLLFIRRYLLTSTIGYERRGGDRWFPRYYQEWHLYWENRLNLVIPVDKVADQGLSAEYLDWWCRVAHRFLSPDVAFHDFRPIVLTEEPRHRGLSQAPPRVQVPDRPDNRRVDRRRRGADDRGVVDHRVPRRRARRQGGRDCRGRAQGRGPPDGDDGSQHVVGEDVRGLETGMDHPTYEVAGSSQMFGSVGPQGFADFATAAVGMDIEDPVSH
ncbi:uncharacterized protein DS421_2g51130 [Arachis hypogaea]|nr:uncharacterized protein DS421_2g51130 [Arachis hypogaea]